MLAQSFGMSDSQTLKELKTAYVECEEQMKEGKEKLEESAIIVQEVAKEIKVKDEVLQRVGAKLVKCLYVLDGKVDEKEALSEDHEHLAEVSCRFN